METVLHRKVEEGASNRYLDLPWRFHEQNGDYWKAARLLFGLAQRETLVFFAISLSSFDVLSFITS